MSIFAKAPQSSFEPAPEGLHQAVCCDVVDLGDVTSDFGTRHKVELRWQLDALDSKGRRFQARKYYTLSLHEKAQLRKDLQTWRGRKFTEQELGGFDLEKLLGVNCQVQIVHNLADNGNTYANVQAIVPHNAKAPRIAPLEYVREQDKPSARGNGNGVEQAGFEEPELDPIPF